MMMARIPEHVTRQVSYTIYANHCEKCPSRINKIFDKGYVSVICANVEICEKIEKENKK